MTPVNFFLHPDKFFTEWAAYPYHLGASLALIVIFTICFCVSWILNDRFRGLPASYSEMNFRRNPELFYQFPLAALLIWSVLAFVECCIVRFLRNDTSYDLIFSILVFCSFPYIVNFSTVSIRNFHRYMASLWLIVPVILATWTLILLWAGFHFACHLGIFQTVIAGLPFATISILAGFLTIKNTEIAIQARSSWRRVEGQKVVIFYPPGLKTSSDPPIVDGQSILSFYLPMKESEEIKQIVQWSDNLLVKVTELLAVESLHFKPYIFLFADDDAHIQILGKDKKYKGFGIAHRDSISLVYGDWNKIGSTISHELCHLLRIHRITYKLSGLLDEGLSCYAQSQQFAGRWQASTALKIPIHFMAYYLIFYDNMYNDRPEFTFTEAYQYAYSLTDYLIMEYGIESYKQLCKKCSVKNEQAYKSGEIMNAAVEELYQISLKELEHNWRTSERHKIRHIRHKEYSQ